MQQIDILKRNIWWSGHLVMNLDVLVVELDRDEDKIAIDDIVVMLSDAVNGRLSGTRLVGRAYACCSGRDRR